MEIQTKFDIEEWLTADNNRRIELGCGTSKQPGYIGIDKFDLPNVDIIFDLEKGLPFLPDNSIDAIYSKHFLEHIDNFNFLFEEIVRVLKPNGQARIYVPHFSSPFYFSDYTHRRFFGLYTFYYFVESDQQLRRKVPNFYSKTRINITSVRLEFTSFFYPIKIFKKLFQYIVNSSPTAQEFYEENMCYMIPCYAMDIMFTPIKSNTFNNS